MFLSVSYCFSVSGCFRVFLNATECLFPSICECFQCVLLVLCVSECLKVFLSVPEYC